MPSQLYSAFDNVRFFEGVDMIKPDLMGDVWPVAEPSADISAYGSAKLAPTGAFEARSSQSFKLIYTVGKLGIDDTGSIRVVFRVVSDFGRLQVNNSGENNYVSATTNGSADLKLKYDPDGHQRPWNKCLTIEVRKGCLRPGDEITISFGSVSARAGGMQLPSAVEHQFEFKVLTDVCAVGHYVPIAESPAIAVVPGKPVIWKALLPTLRRPGERFCFGLKAEDKWGNPTDQAAGNFRLLTTLPVDGLPEEIIYKPGNKSLCFDNLKVLQPGCLRITVLGEGDSVIAASPPLVIEAGRHGGYWGDLHGQTGETVGLNTARSYFEFARDLAFLDVTAHQANDFQINNRFWAHINELTAEFLQEGRFVTFPGYEWSGNTAVGGDRNVFFATEGRQIHRSSHSLLPNRSDLGTDAHDANELFNALKAEDCIVYAHVGGRYADIGYAHDGRIETAVEIHSAWGTFEWLLTDSFDLGYRCGVVCNSDGHKGRPGASYPGASEFGAYGGLTCFLAEELSRKGILESQRRRHHYGTSGARLYLDVQVDFPTPATVFARDPNLFDNPDQEQINTAMMGDIVQTRDNEVTLRLQTITQAPIERIEIRSGKNVLKTLYGYGKKDLSSRIRVLCCGAEYRGRGRETHWDGEARFKAARITRMEKINIWNHERKCELIGEDKISWQTITTGNFCGFDVWLEEGEDARLEVETNHGSLRAKLKDIGRDDLVREAGGLERRLRIFRLPEENTTYEMTAQLKIAITPSGDNPLWVCVTTQDGFQAWSSPVYVFQK